MGEQRLGRGALLDAASLLMDERGIDDVSLNEITEASGHRNRSAISYHFGSREAIVQELFAQTMAVVEAERNALLDHLETTGTEITERGAYEIVVGPLARQLRTPEGRRYLRLCAQLIDHPRYVRDARDAIAVNTSVQRCIRYLAPALPHLPPEIAAERASQAPSFLVRACADQARLLDSDAPSRPALGIEAFTANLVDVIIAIVSAPTSVDGETDTREAVA